MNLSKIEVILITSFISLAILLFGSWFLKYYMNTLTIFSAIDICFIGALMVMLQNLWTIRHKSERHVRNKSSTDLESTGYQDNKASTSIIAEIENDETAINVLLAIKSIENDFQEDSEVLGSPIRIPESEISKHSDVSLGITQRWIGKLKKAHFLKEGFGEIYGVKQPGLEFLKKMGSSLRLTLAQN